MCAADTGPYVHAVGYAHSLCRYRGVGILVDARRRRSALLRDRVQEGQMRFIWLICASGRRLPDVWCLAGLAA